MDSAQQNARRDTKGFTLIELSIVLVIIGLLVGGVLVGQDLVRAAQVRATVTQIEKYNTAANTFREKYGYLPGDIPDPAASSFGFLPRGTSCSAGAQCPGLGDGNGLIQGYAAGANGIVVPSGETGMFWTDLSAAHLIDGNFSINTFFGEIIMNTIPNNGSSVSNYLPAAKVGGGNFVYAYSGVTNCCPATGNWINYFGLSQVTGSGAPGGLTSLPGLTVQQAYSIDQKMDDGLPQTGNVTAGYAATNITLEAPVWAAGGGTQGTSNTAATPGSATTCYDNGGVAGTQHYSVEQNGGAGVNCALSFRFQ